MRPEAGQHAAIAVSISLVSPTGSTASWRIPLDARRTG